MNLLDNGQINEISECFDKIINTFNNVFESIIETISSILEELKELLEVIKKKRKGRRIISYIIKKKLYKLILLYKN